jgi:signal transduction histidine kinase
MVVSSVDRAMLSIVRLLGRSLNLREVGQAIAEAAAQLPTADAAAVMRLDREQDELFVEAGAGLPSNSPLRLPVARTAAGRAMIERSLVVIENLEQDPGILMPDVPDEHFRAVIAAPLPGDAEPRRAISIYRKSPGAFPVGTPEFMTMLADAAQAALRNAREFEREAHFRREQEAINEAALAMSSELSLDRLLQLIVQVARDLVGARYAALGVPGPDGKLEQFITSGISPMLRERIGPLPEGHGLLGALLKDNKVLRLRRIQDHPLSYGFPPHHPSMTSFLGVPILFRGRNVGDLYLTEKLDGPEFTADDERVVVMLAAHAGIAIANARSYGATNEELHLKVEELAEKNRELQRLSNGILAAQEDERRRIARELHDDTMQSLAALAVQARLVERKRELELMREGVARIREGIGQTLRELRRLAYDLRPTALDDLGLTAALGGLAADFADRQAVMVESDLATPEERLPGPVEIVLYRVAQEALSNVAKHAEAKHVSLSFSLPDGMARLTVRDDGKGFHTDERRSSRESGLGLLGMEERVQALHGRIMIESSEGEGTTVQVELPRTGLD